MSRREIINRWMEHKELKEPPKHLHGEQLPEWFEPEYQIDWMTGVLEANEIAARYEAETGQPMGRRHYNWWLLNISAAAMTRKDKVEMRNRIQNERGERFPYDE